MKWVKKMSSNKKYLFHSSAVDIFRSKVFNNIFTKYDITGDEQVITENTKDGVKIRHKGFVIKDKDSKRNYFIPSSGIKNNEKVSITDLMPIRIKKSREIDFRNKVFHLVENNYVTVRFQECNDMLMKDFFDNWFNIEHTNPKDL